MVPAYTALNRLRGILGARPETSFSLDIHFWRPEIPRLKCAAFPLPVSELNARSTNSIHDACDGLEQAVDGA
jgi:hypothetical protein